MPVPLLTGPRRALLTPDVLAQYPGAYVVTDWMNGVFALGGFQTDNPLELPGFSCVRSSIGYAQTPSGILVRFAANQPRWLIGSGLLVEEARTNLLLRSQEFGVSPWLAGNGTSVQSDVYVAPDGTLTADAVAAGNTGSSSVLQTVTAANTEHTLTFYIRAGTSTRAAFGLYSTTTGSFYPVTATVLSGSGITSVSVLNLASITGLTSQWARVSLATTGAVSAGNLRVFIYPDADANGANQTIGATVGLWGAQIEAGSFPTSYIPTTSATATRGSDVISMAGLSIATPLTMFADFTFEGADSSVNANARIAMQLDDGTNSNRSLIYNISGVGGVTQVSGATQAIATISGTVPTGSVRRVAYRVKADDFNAASNGVLATPDLSGTVTGAYSSLNLGKSATGGPLNGYVRRAIIYPRAFSDAELQAVTA